METLEQLAGKPNPIFDGSKKSLLEFLSNSIDLTDINLFSIKGYNSAVINVFQSDSNELDKILFKLHGQYSSWIDRFLEIEEWELLSSLYLTSSTIAERVYEITNTPSWLEMAYIDKRSAADISFEKLSKDAGAGFYGYSGDIAEKLAVKYRKFSPKRAKEFASCAIECFQNYINHFQPRRNNGKKIMETIRIFNAKIEYLKANYITD